MEFRIEVLHFQNFMLPSIRLKRAAEINIVNRGDFSVGMLPSFR